MDNNKLPHLLFYGPPGTGKCLGYNTPIIMYDGSIKMVQDITKDELLMGDDNKPRKVLSTVTGKDIMYKIIQDNGDNYIVNSEHIISLKLSIQFIQKDENDQIILYWFEKHILKKKIFVIQHMDTENNLEKEYLNYLNLLSTNPNVNKIGDICDISIQDYINKDDIWKDVYKGYKSNKITCWNTKKVKIDPYILGYWLSNNSDFKEEIKILIDDYELFQYNLNEYNLINNKYIPNEYKVNDTKTRLELLAGFIDGNCHNVENNFMIMQNNELLLNDILFIIRSLGFIVSIESSIINNKSVYQCNIHNSSEEIIPTIKLKEKKIFNNYKDLLYDIKIKKLENDNYYGFEIDGNKRFLLGDFTVTHNTSLIIAIAKHYYKEDFENMILVLNASEERGIETVRNRIKQFVITKGIPSNKTIPSFKLIILDEIDAMTEDAQAILRKVIEKYVNNVRFCFICNYLKKINPAIQSRCIIFRFQPIPYNNMYDFIIKICTNENILITLNAINLIIKKSNGDMRKLLNIIQSIYMFVDTDLIKKIKPEKFIFDSDQLTKECNDIVITESCVSKILSCPTHKHINNILQFIQKNNLKKSYKYVNNIIITNGISLIELVNYIYEFCIDYIINNNKNIIKYELDKVVKIIKNICLINENLTYCNNDNIQLVSLLAVFYI
jgi:DNA polymerase III delta prime subunit